MEEKKDTKFKKGHKKLGGRKKGTPNAFPAEVAKAMSASFEAVGKTEYFITLAQENPQVYAALIMKHLPSKIEAEVVVDDSLSRTLAERRKKALER